LLKRLISEQAKSRGEETVKIDDEREVRALAVLVLTEYETLRGPTSTSETITLLKKNSRSAVVNETLGLLNS